MWGNVYISCTHMSRISIDVTDEEHKKLKAMAALRGKSIKDYVIERTLKGDQGVEPALRELEKLLDRRIQEAEAGHLSRRTAKEIFAQEGRKQAK